MPFRKMVLPYGLFAVLFIVYSGEYYGKLIPTDAVSYISIADKYASENFSKAVNAYWSPLYSWLIALQMKLGISVDAAIHFLKGMAGLMIIFFSGKIVSHYNWPIWAEEVCMSLIAVCAANFSLLFATPDALMAALLLYFLYIFIKGNWVKHPLLTGTLGAVLFFTKAFGFYFFLAFLCLFLIWKSFTAKVDFLFFLKKAFITIVGFLLLGFLWLSAIHHRYGRWTISTAGTYNHNLMRYGGGSVQPVLKSGLLPLPDTAAYNSWEEITLVYPTTDWNPFENGTFLRLQLSVIANNLWGVLQYLRSLHLLLWIALMAGLVMAGNYVMAPRGRRRALPGHFRISTIITAFIGLYAFGYSIAGVDYRYLYVVFIGTFFLFFDTLVNCKNRFPATAILCYGIAGWLVGQSCYRVIADLHLRRNELKIQMVEVQKLRKIIPAESVVATHATNSINAMDYRGKWHNHGGLEAYTKPLDAIKALQHYHVQWVIIPEKVVQQYQWIHSCCDTSFRSTGWEVFRLKADQLHPTVSKPY